MQAEDLLRHTHTHAHAPPFFESPIRSLGYLFQLSHNLVCGILHVIGECFVMVLKVPACVCVCVRALKCVYISIFSLQLHYQLQGQCSVSWFFLFSTTWLKHDSATELLALSTCC